MGISTRPVLLILPPRANTFVPLDFSVPMEANQSAPNTENLFKLAEIFGTTVDFLLASREAENSPAEQIHQLYKLEEEKKAKAAE